MKTILMIVISCWKCNDFLAHGVHKLLAWRSLYFFIILGLLNFILKEWCTISRGAEPHARKAYDEKVLKKVAHTCGVIWAERSDGPDYTTSVYYYYYYDYFQLLRLLRLLRLLPLLRLLRLLSLLQPLLLLRGLCARAPADTRRYPCPWTLTLVGIHYRGVQWEGGAVGGGSII